jgi:hypothetical protein
MEAAVTAAKNSYCNRGDRGRKPSVSWLSYFNTLGQIQLAESEPETYCKLLFEGQRADGFMPNMSIVGREVAALPIQGVLIGILLHEARKSAERLIPALRKAYARALAQHRYLYTFRDFWDEGLIAILHPEEDGFGNAPGYTFPKAGFGGIQDPFFNTCLIWSNESLIQVGHFLGEDVLELIQWHELSIHSMNEKLWDERSGYYHAYDLMRQCHIPVDTLAGILPMAAEIPTQEQAERIWKVLETAPWRSAVLGNGLYPSCRLDALYADFKKGWRGPIWLVLNWMLYHGLTRYDFSEAAAKLRIAALRYISEYGFHDAYDPRFEVVSGHPGIGAATSPSAAALALHWLLK